MPEQGPVPVGHREDTVGEEPHDAVGDGKKANLDGQLILGGPDPASVTLRRHRDRHCIAGALGIPGGAQRQAEGDRT